jgi:hypothetical protein
MGDISLRRALSDRSNGQQTVSIRSIVDGLGMIFPVSCRDLVGLLEPIDLKFALTTGSTSMNCEITMTSSGVLRFQGSVHDGGLISVKYGVLSVFPNAVSDPILEPMVLEHIGEISGTFGFGSRDDHWDQSVNSETIATSWKTIKQAAGSATTKLYTDSGLFEAAEAVAAGLTGAFVFKL